MRHPKDPTQLLGVFFPGKEIVQPTIVESISFLAWKDEAFQLGLDWARCYDAETPSRLLIEDIMNKWYLINIGKLYTAQLFRQVCTNFGS